MNKKSDLDQFKASLITPLPSSNSKYLVENLFTFKLAVTPEEIWPYLSDTSKMNKEMGFPPRLEQDIDGENHVSTKTLGRDEKWIEKPWIWVEEKELQNYRVFKQGWMTDQRGVFSVKPVTDGCEVSIYFRWGFSSFFSKILFSMIGPLLKKNFSTFLENKVNSIKSNSSKIILPKSVLIEPESPYETVLDYLRKADELDLDRIHLKKLSVLLDLPLDLLLEITHRLVNEGYLSFTWDVVCPHCRGAKVESNSLSSLDNMNECESCEVEFSLEPEESVEVVFHVTAKLRTVGKFVYCAAEPSKKKHIKLSQVVAPNEKREFSLKLTPGIYRIRCKYAKDTAYLDVNEKVGMTSVDWKGNPGERFSARPMFDFSFSNLSENEEMISIEEAWWFQDRLLPKEVLSHPSMRTLFNEDHLKVGVKLNIGTQVILFTDIVGSTPFYKTHGDALALKVVQAHYVEVSEIIRKHRGVVVKYIGDAVMAAFVSIESAYECSMEIHQCFNPERTDSPVKLRISFHRGPVLCANINVGLDYFGTTVNQSAKIQKWAGAHEVALLEEDWELLKEKLVNSKSETIYDEKLELKIRVLKASGT